MNTELELKALERKFGSVEYEGRKIILLEQAYQTSRLLNEYPNDLQYQGSGDFYMDEWEAEGITDSGDNVFVRWHFKIQRNEEDESVVPDDAYAWSAEADSYDWDDVYDVIER